MGIYIQYQKNEILLVPNKCGIHSFRHAFDIQNFIENENQYKPIYDFPTFSYINESYEFTPTLEKFGLLNFNITGIIRNPIHWIISGYRFFVSNYNYKLDFKNHLQKILDNDEQDIFWLEHCAYLPMSRYPKNISLLKIEDNQNINKYLSLFGRQLESIHYNKTTDVEYPNITKDTKNMLVKIVENYDDYYDIEETLNQINLTDK